MGVIEISLLMIGTVIGAGFATGAEIVAFFGRLALPAPLLAGLIFFAMFFLISIIIYLRNMVKPRITRYFSLILYFIFLTAMTAGVAEIANLFFCVVSLIISVAVVLCGFSRMAKFNTVIVIAIVVILPGICLPHLGHAATIPAAAGGQIFGGVIAAVLYAALNCCMLDKIVDGCKKSVLGKKLYISAAVASAAIAVFAYLILHAIRVNDADGFAVPMLAISPTPITFVMILLAILTSQYSALYAVAAAGNKNGVAPVCVIALLAFVCSFFGFSRLVGIFYPIIGVIISLLLISLLLISFFRPKPSRSVLPHISLHQTHPHSES